MNRQNSIGVYFSANNKVYNWVIPFLNSFRQFNPNLRLILIPFNEECDRTLALQEKYNFEIYIDSSFEELEAIGQAFELGHTPTGKYWFRRYASFWGVLDRFMYLDARQVVLADLTPFIIGLDEYNFDFLHYDCAINQVYQDGELRREFLRKGKGRGFLSGLWASKKGLFSLKEFQELTESALQVREQLNPRNTDQAFINYCCDMKSITYSHFAEVMGGICQNGWARQSGNIYRDNGKYYLWDYGGLDHKKQVILVHWAGYQWGRILPHRWLLLSFIYKNPLSLLLNYLFWQIYLVPKFLMMSILSQKDVNSIYHFVKNNFLK